MLMIKDDTSAHWDLCNEQRNAVCR